MALDLRPVDIFPHTDETAGNNSTVVARVLGSCLAPERSATRALGSSTPAE